MPTRLDLRIYKDSPRAIEDLVKGEIDFAQLNSREFLRARQLDPKIQALIAILPSPGFNDAAVIFTRKNTGIRSLANLRGKSFLLGSTNSTMSFWTKVALVDSGIRAKDFSKYRYITQTNDLFPDGKSMPAVAVGNPFSPMTPVEAVIAGVYDAGVVGEKRFREVAAEHQLIALHRFQENGDLIVARGNLPSDATHHFQRALVDLKSANYDQIFHDAPARFRMTTENDFKEMSRRLEAEGEFVR
jgi:ABC-type phosphate/phosphonate transport system substrate-binding protein